MASVNKTVDKTLVNGSEIFVYTISVSYSGLTQPAQNGKLVDFFPDKILYQLPKPGGQLISISENKVAGGTNVEFNFGSVNAGTSLTFTVACSFGPGRVDDDSFTNKADLYADSALIATANAPKVNLKLDNNFVLRKIPNIDKAVVPNQLITFRLVLQNTDDPGSEIRDVVIQDVLPPQLIADTSFTPVGNDTAYQGYEDTTYNGLTGSWNGNTLNFALPAYKGGSYEILFKARVAQDVIPGERITNTAKWTAGGVAKTDAKTSFTVFKDEAKIFLEKYGPLYSQIGGAVQYRVSASSGGTVPLGETVLTDTVPPELDITKVMINASPAVVPSYSIYVETSELAGSYKTVAENLAGNSGAYDLSPFIPANERVLSVRIVFASMEAKNTSTSMYLYGTVNDTARPGGVIVNKADIIGQSSLGSVSRESEFSTTLNGKSLLNVSKNLIPYRQTYYPLNEFSVKLSARGNKGNITNPIFADLLPLGLDYVPGNDYFIFFNLIENTTYDSRKQGFPIPLPVREVIKDYKGTGRTLVRFKFQDFTLLYANSLSVYFDVLVTLNPPSSFKNVGYLGNVGDNTQIDGIPYTDVLDMDGDSLTGEQIVQSSEVSATILTTSEFSLEKWVKGNLSEEFSKASKVSQGGDIVYKLNVTNNQDMELKNIELVDILPYAGDTGVILNTTPRGSQFDVYATADVTAQIVNILGDPVSPGTEIKIEYSTSRDPLRFDESGNNTIGSGEWTLTPPLDITTLAAVRVTTGENVILKPYERLIVSIKAKAPSGVNAGRKAYNSYAVRADKISGGVTSKMNPAEPNKVSVQTADTKKASVGSFVWLDSNGDGLHDAGEEGVNGVIVELYSSDGTKLAETVTANDADQNPGYYSFTELASGNYYVKFIPYGDYALTVQKPTEANGSRPDSTTGITAQFNLAENEKLTTINAGVLLPPCAPPVIYAFDKCILVGDNFDPMDGVTAVDCDGKDITAFITADSSVDNLKEGVYSVIYTVTDSRGQTTTKTIKVKVCGKKGPRYQAVTDLFQSVALEQTALSHIINAEGEKIQKAIKLDVSAEDMLKINDSVKDMTNTIARLEMVLKGKLELFECHICKDSCCKK